MKSPEIKLSFEGYYIAYATSCSFEITVNLREVTQTPSDSDYDSWSHYAIEDIVSNISSDSFYATQQTMDLVDLVGEEFELGLEFGDDLSFEFNSLLVEAGIVGNIKELARLSLKFQNSEVL